MTERKRGKGGRFEREAAEAEEADCTVTQEKKSRAPQPRFSRVYVRAKLAKALPTIVAKLVEQAAAGSVPHMALLLKAAGLDNKNELVPPARKRPEKSVAALLMEEWDRQKAQ